MQSYSAAFLLACSIAMTACGDAGRRDAGTGDQPSAADKTATDTAGGNVTAQLRDSAGKDLGTLTLSEAGGKISVTGKLDGLPPGEHAIHLHMAGQCDAPKFEGAGDHWNPTNAAHGTKHPKGPHLGDLPNLTVARDSSVAVQVTSAGGSLRGTNALVDSDGASVVVHAKRDDYRSQPAGDSGDKIACGTVSSEQ